MRNIKRIILVAILSIMIMSFSLVYAAEEIQSSKYITEDDLLYSETYVVKKDLITRIPERTSVSDFLKNITVAKDCTSIKLYKGDTVVTTDYQGYIGTGMKVVGSNKKECTIVVSGDINGDGISNQIDLTRLIRHVVKLENWQLSEAQAQAVNLSLNKEITIEDIVNVREDFVKPEQQTAPAKIPTPDVPDMVVTGTKEGDYYINRAEIKITQKEGSGNVRTSYKITGSKTVDETEIKSGSVVVLTENGEYKVTAYTYGSEGQRSKSGNVDIKVREKADYKVEHYIEKTDGTYELREEQTINEDVGKEVSAVIRHYSGYTKVATDDEVLKGTVTRDGRLVLKVYYKMDKYTITYDLGGGALEEDKVNPTEYTVVSDKIVLNNPSRNGYVFLGWTGANGEQPSKEVKIAKESTGNRAYKANWQAIKYTITYELNGGTAEGNPVEYTIESDEITLKAPTKTGYKFLGWTGSNGTEKQTEVKIAKGSTENKSYTANWELEKYIIMYELDGGELEEGKTNPTEYTVESDEIILNNPTREGFEFLGWMGSNGELPEETVKIPKGSTKNKVYMALWEAKAYTITYQLNGGTDNGNVKRYTAESDDIVLKAPTKTGYRFLGWTGSNGTEKQTEVRIPRGSIGNKTYTAHWEANKYTITYGLNGGTVEGNAVEYTVESDTITLNNPSKTGYTFLGWTGSNGETASKAVVLAKGSTGDRTYIANWQVETYTINYELNGGVVQNVAQYTIESEITLNNPTKAGYTFLGWSEGESTEKVENVTITKGTMGNKSYTANWAENTDTAYRVLYYTGLEGEYELKETVRLTGKTNETVDAEIKNYPGYTKIDTPRQLLTAPILPDGSLALKVYYDAIKYTISYELNGGAVSESNPADYIVETDTFTLKEPTKAGYVFTGWTGSNGDTPQKNVKVTKGSTGNKEYSANWAKVYTIDYDLDGGRLAEENPTEYTTSTDDIVLKNPTKTGYTFKGWTGSNGDELQEEVKITKGSTGNKSYRAHWQINTYTVTFVDGEDESTRTIEHGDVISKPTDPSKEGHTFRRWSETANGSAEYDFDTPVTKNIKLYAVYTKTIYIVTFTNGSERSESSVEHGDKVTKPAIHPTKEGEAFKYWSEEENGEEFDFDTPITEAKTLYAVFGDISHNVFANYSAETKSLVFTTSLKAGTSWDITDTEYISSSEVPWKNVREDITSIVFEDTVYPKSTAYWFYGFNNDKLTEIDVSNLNTSSVTDMGNMFWGCLNVRTIKGLTSSNFDTSNVTDMNRMFYDCEALTSLDVSGFDTSKVTTMNRMFSHLFKLETLTGLDSETFDTSNVTNMQHMFSFSKAIKELNLSEFNTEKVTDFSGMFSNSTGLESVNLSGFNTSSATKMDSMFYKAADLKVIAVGDDWTTEGKEVEDMFEGCGTSRVTKITDPE